MIYSDDIIRWINSKGELNHKLSDLTNEQLIKTLLYYLNVTELSDGGREFRPNTISSCRVMDGSIINSVLKEMEKRIK